MKKSGFCDAAHALQVVAVVGDDQRVAAGADVDGVVGADQRAQHGHQVGRVFMHEAEDLRLHLPAAGAPRRLRPHAAATQLDSPPGAGSGYPAPAAGCPRHRPGSADAR